MRGARPVVEPQRDDHAIAARRVGHRGEQTAGGRGAARGHACPGRVPFPEQPRVVGDEVVAGLEAGPRTAEDEEAAAGSVVDHRVPPPRRGRRIRGRKRDPCRRAAQPVGVGQHEGVAERHVVRAATAEDEQPVRGRVIGPGRSAARLRRHAVGDELLPGGAADAVGVRQDPNVVEVRSLATRGATEDDHPARRRIEYGHVTGPADGRRWQRHPCGRAAQTVGRAEHPGVGQRCLAQALAAAVKDQAIAGGVVHRGGLPSRVRSARGRDARPHRDAARSRGVRQDPGVRQVGARAVRATEDHDPVGRLVVGGGRRRSRAGTAAWRAEPGPTLSRDAERVPEVDVVGHGIAVRVGGGPGERRIEARARGPVGRRDVHGRGGRIVRRIVVEDRDLRLPVAQHRSGDVPDVDGEGLGGLRCEVADDGDGDEPGRAAGRKGHGPVAPPVVALGRGRPFPGRVGERHRLGARRGQRDREDSVHPVALSLDDGHVRDGQRRQGCGAERDHDVVGGAGLGIVGRQAERVDTRHAQRRRRRGRGRGRERHGAGTAHHAPRDAEHAARGQAVVLYRAVEGGDHVGKDHDLIGAGVHDRRMVHGPDRHRRLVRGRELSVGGGQAEHVDPGRAERCRGVDGMGIRKGHGAGPAQLAPGHREGPRGEAVVHDRSVEGHGRGRIPRRLIDAGVHPRRVVRRRERALADQEVAGRRGACRLACRLRRVGLGADFGDRHWVVGLGYHDRDASGGRPGNGRGCHQCEVDAPVGVPLAFRAEQQVGGIDEGVGLPVAVPRAVRWLVAVGARGERERRTRSIRHRGRQAHVPHLVVRGPEQRVHDGGGDGKRVRLIGLMDGLEHGGRLGPLGRRACPRLDRGGVMSRGTQPAALPEWIGMRND